MTPRRCWRIFSSFQSSLPFSCTFLFFLLRISLLMRLRHRLPLPRHCLTLLSVVSLSHSQGCARSSVCLPFQSRCHVSFQRRILMTPAAPELLSCDALMWFQGHKTGERRWMLSLLQVVNISVVFFNLNHIVTFDCLSRHYIMYTVLVFDHCDYSLHAGFTHHVWVKSFFCPCFMQNYALIFRWKRVFRSRSFDRFLLLVESSTKAFCSDERTTAIRESHTRIRSGFISQQRSFKDDLGVWLSG